MNNKEFTNVSVSKKTHETLVSHVDATGVKIGKFVDKAIMEKIEREKGLRLTINPEYAHLLNLEVMDKCIAIANTKQSI